MKTIDKFLNSITMYRLVMYGLGTLAVISVAFSFFGLVSFTALQLGELAVVLIVSCWLTAEVFAHIYKGAINPESPVITALILFFVLAPAQNMSEVGVIFLTGLIAIASKYIFSVNDKHLFNPAAIAAVLITFFGSGQAVWWVATPALSVFTAVLAFLIIRKIRRFHLFFAFIVGALPAIIYFNNPISILAGFALIWRVLISWPLLFFAGVMLTEPLTGPYNKINRIIYGILVGLLFGSQFVFGPVYSTPELALVIGNIFAYLVSAKYKARLYFKNKKEIADGVYEFYFSTDQEIKYKPGQYFEWTLDHDKSDNRGVRRYFTISSSPTYDDLSIAVRLDPNKASSFKKSLLDLKPGDQMFASQLSGDFVMPRNKKQKLAFIAGGIGVTPFASMVRYLLSRGQQRDVCLFYAAQNNKQFAYLDLFAEASDVIGLKTFYLATETDGYLTAKKVIDSMPDYKSRLFYISGPNAMVENYKKMLLSAGVSHSQIRTDYFPGF